MKSPQLPLALLVFSVTSLAAAASAASIAPRLSTSNFHTNGPAPPTADLGVTMTDGQTSATPGGMVTYTIVATNFGPSDVTGATIVDTFPPALSNVSWSCTASMGSACNPGGSGGLDQLMNLVADGTATFTVTADVNPGATGSLTNSVTVTPPSGTTDGVGGNNTATDTDSLPAATTPGPTVPTVSGAALALLAGALTLSAAIALRSRG